MPLAFTGERGGSEDFETLLEAHDDNGERVVIVTSTEAIDDHGLPAVQARASDKFDAGVFDAAGRVRVMTSDLG